MKRLLIIAVRGLFTAVFAVAFTAVGAYAEDQSSGCGLGWQVSRRNSLVSSFARSLTNATFSNTIGMTSGTSGCSRHMIVKNDKQDIHYAEANYNELMVEMAAGQGEYLQGFAAVLGCRPAAYKAFSGMTQSKYSEIFSAGQVGPDAMLKKVKHAIHGNAELASNCGNVTT